MNALHTIASVWRSAGRGMLSAHVRIVKTGLAAFVGMSLALPPSYAQESNERVIVLCVKDSKATGLAVCDESNLKPCIGFSNGCVECGGVPIWLQVDAKLLPPVSGDPMSLLSQTPVSRKAQELMPLATSLIGDPARLMVSPNPSQGQIRVVLMGSSRYRVHVYRLSGGKPIFSHMVDNEEGVIVQLPEKGQYIVIVEEGDTIWHKLILNE